MIGRGALKILFEMVHQTQPLAPEKITLAAEILKIFKKLTQAEAALYQELPNQNLIITSEDNILNFQNANEFGMTLLIKAASNNHLEIVRMLLAEEEIDPNIANNEGHTALMYASARNYLSIVQALFADKRTKPNLGNKYGSTALMYACERGYLAVVSEFLADDRVDPTIINRNGEAALSIAAQYGWALVVSKLLTDKRVMADAQKNIGNKALSWAIKKGFLEIIEILIEKGQIDVNYVNEKRETPLDSINLKPERDLRVINLLLSYNAKINNPQEFLKCLIYHSWDFSVLTSLKYLHKQIKQSEKINKGLLYNVTEYLHSLLYLLVVKKHQYFAAIKHEIEDTLPVDLLTIITEYCIEKDNIDSNGNYVVFSKDEKELSVLIKKFWDKSFLSLLSEIIPLRDPDIFIAYLNAIIPLDLTDIQGSQIYLNFLNDCLGVMNKIAKQKLNLDLIKNRDNIHAFLARMYMNYSLHHKDEEAKKYCSQAIASWSAIAIPEHVSISDNVLLGENLLKQEDFDTKLKAQVHLEYAAGKNSSDALQLLKLTFTQKNQEVKEEKFEEGLRFFLFNARKELTQANIENNINKVKKGINKYLQTKKPSFTDTLRANCFHTLIDTCKIALGKYVYLYALLVYPGKDPLKPFVLESLGYKNMSEVVILLRQFLEKELLPYKIQFASLEYDFIIPLQKQMHSKKPDIKIFLQFQDQLSGYFAKTPTLLA